MASSQAWDEFNGASAGTVTSGRTECNWKAVDDSSTAYSASPVTAGNYSYSKYQALRFTGTWNNLSAFTYKIDNNQPATGVSINGVTTSTAATPVSTNDTADTALSTTGIAANFTSSSTPFLAGTSSSTASGTMYVQALKSQLKTASTAAPGDIASRTITATWTES